MTTIGTNPDCPGGIQLLADHLDTALAVGEDLLAMVLAPRADLDEADPATAPEAIDRFVRRTAELEVALLVRVLQARRRAGEIGRADASLKAAASLFQAQTALLVELIEGADRQQPNGLGGTGDGLAYLRSRGLLAPEAAAPSPFESIVVTEDLRVGGVVALGALLDLVSALLDLLDVRFGLYAVMPDDAPAAVAQVGSSQEEHVVAVDEAVIAAADPASEVKSTSPAATAEPAIDTLAARLSVAGATELEQPA